MKLFVLFIPVIVCSCSTVQVDNSSNKYGFYPKPGMNEDAQDRNNTKYNLMDSSDGRQDPTANIKFWGATY